MKTESGVDETARLLDGIDGAMESLREKDPTQSEEIIGNQLLQMSVVSGTSTPPVFFNYHHCGYDDAWDRPEWSDPHMDKTFGEYMGEATQRGWWGGLTRPGQATDPQVLFVVGTNPLRRSRWPGEATRQPLAQARKGCRGRLPHVDDRPARRHRAAGSHALRAREPAVRVPRTPSC